MAETNPYTPSAGYQNINDMAVTGYGLTFETIRYWLVENHLPTEVSTKFNEKTVEDYNKLLNTFDATNLIEVFESHNNDEDLTVLLMPAVLPGKHDQIIPSQDKVNEQLCNAIILLFDLNKNNQEALLPFIEEYADSISVCEYFDD